MATTEVLFNPFLPEFHADPYPFYRRLREREPVHQTPMGFRVLTRYDDCVAVLRDARFGREEFQQMLSAVYGGEDSDRLPRSMLFRDPPDHTRLRALVSKAFTPRVIEQMRDHIQEIVDRLLSRALGQGGMDVVEDLAYPLPVTVICEMLGYRWATTRRSADGRLTSRVASTPSGCLLTRASSTAGGWPAARWPTTSERWCQSAARGPRPTCCPGSWAPRSRATS